MSHQRLYNKGKPICPLLELNLILNDKRGCWNAWRCNINTTLRAFIKNAMGLWKTTKNLELSKLVAQVTIKCSIYQGSIYPLLISARSSHFIPVPKWNNHQSPPLHRWHQVVCQEWARHQLYDAAHHDIQKQYRNLIWTRKMRLNGIKREANWLQMKGLNYQRTK